MTFDSEICGSPEGRAVAAPLSCRRSLATRNENHASATRQAPGGPHPQTFVYSFDHLAGTTRRDGWIVRPSSVEEFLEIRTCRLKIRKPAIGDFAPDY